MTDKRPQVIIEPCTANTIHVTIETENGEVVLHVSHEEIQIQRSALKVKVMP